MNQEQPLTQQEQDPMDPDLLMMVQDFFFMTQFGTGDQVVLQGDDRDMECFCVAVDFKEQKRVDYRIFRFNRGSPPPEPESTLTNIDIAALVDRLAQEFPKIRKIDLQTEGESVINIFNLDEPAA